MRESCPDSSVWVAWSAGSLDPSTRSRREGHLTACPSCRAELASLVVAGQVPLRPGLQARWAALAPARGGRRWQVASLAAAALLLLLGGLFRRSREAMPPGDAGPAPLMGDARVGSEARGVAPDLVAGSLLEVMVGSAGQIAMAPGSRGRISGARAFRLERGIAWVAAVGEPLRITLMGWEGTLEMEDADVLVHVDSAPAARAGLFLGTAWGREGVWGVSVLRGEVTVRSADGTRRLGAGQVLGVLPPSIRDPRGWRIVPGGPWAVRDGIQAFLPSGPGLPCVAEVLLRKKDSAAEAALLFEAAGRTWQVPLGVHLPVDRGWVRLRLELGTGKVRLMAGGEEVLSCRPEALPALSYPAAGKTPWGIKAWGGDVEIREARWRADGP